MFMSDDDEFMLCCLFQIEVHFCCFYTSWVLSLVHIKMIGHNSFNHVNLKLTLFGKLPNPTTFSFLRWILPSVSNYIAFDAQSRVVIYTVVYT